MSAIQRSGDLDTTIFSEVAALCHLDPLSVRRVLTSGLQGVSPDEYQKIRESAQALGYPVSMHTHNLGILFEEESGRGLTHTFFATVLNSLKDEAEQQGYDITFINHNSIAGSQSYVEHCRVRNVDGVCLVCTDFRSPEVKELIESGIPCVTVDHLFKKVPAVLSDNETGVQKLVEYAISLGHRRIAFIHGHNNSIVTKARISQYTNTLEFHGIKVPADYLLSGLYDDIALTRSLVKQLLSMSEPPTCILLPNDMVYLGAIEATRDLGLSIPRDISFAGYDGIELTQILSPALTTIRQNNAQLGRAAAQRLIDCIRNPEKAPRKASILPVEFLPGKTMAPPRSA